MLTSRRPAVSMWRVSRSCSLWALPLSCPFYDCSAGNPVEPPHFMSNDSRPERGLVGKDLTTKPDSTGLIPGCCRGEGEKQFQVGLWPPRVCCGTPSNKCDLKDFLKLKNRMILLHYLHKYTNIYIYTLYYTLQVL